MRKNRFLHIFFAVPAFALLCFCSRTPVTSLAEESTAESPNDTAAAENTTDTAQAADAADTAQDADAADTAPDTDATNTAQAADAADTAPDTDAADTSTYQPGILTDTGYESEWLNLAFTQPADMTMTAAEELDSFMQAGQTAIAEGSGQTLDESAWAGTIYEMMASSTSGCPNVLLLTEPTIGMTAEQYLEAVRQHLETSQMGYTFTDSFGSLTIAEQSFSTMDVSLNSNGTALTQRYCTLRKEDRFITVILTFFQDNAPSADEILAAFTPLHAADAPEAADTAGTPVETPGEASTEPSPDTAAP